METFELRSPDRRNLVRFDYEGEIRFGPPYYRVTVNDRVLDGRVFGIAGVWSVDSRYVALQRWNTTQESKGPDTSLYVVRLEDLTAHDRPTVRKGWIVPQRFEGTRIVYLKDTRARTGTSEELGLDLTDGALAWTPVFRERRLPG